MAPMRLAWVLPMKGFLPEAISYSIAPRAKMSLRASASLPSICSGDMYWNVPRIVPSTVSGALAGVSVRRREKSAPLTSASGVKCLARPKSRSLTPDAVSMMLPGLRSRWITPLLWALSRASAIWTPISMT